MSCNRAFTFTATLLEQKEKETIEIYNLHSKILLLQLLYKLTLRMLGVIYLKEVLFMVRVVTFS